MKKIYFIPLLCLSFFSFLQTTKTKIEEGTIILIKSLSIISANTTWNEESF